MNISIIIPNYNGEDLLRKNLPKVIKIAESYKKGNIEIIVIDDCSTDNSIKTIQSLTQITGLNRKINLKIIQNEKNLGFSPTVNKAAKEATGEVLVLLNTDVLPEEFFLEPLIKNFDDNKVFAVGCMDKSIEDGKTVFRGRGLGKWEKGFLIHRKGEVSKNNTLWVNGGSGAFRRSIWNKLSGFNELYAPFYWEDIDLSYRALKSGYRVLFEPKSTVVHEHEEGSIKKTVKPMSVRITSYRNQFYFVWINITDLSFIVSHLFWLPLQLFSATIHGDTAFLRGFLLAFFHVPQVLIRRQKVQSLTKISDHSILARFSE